jgi:hypothetical protein
MNNPGLDARRAFLTALSSEKSPGEDQERWKSHFLAILPCFL